MLVNIKIVYFHKEDRRVYNTRMLINPDWIEFIEPCKEDEPLPAGCLIHMRPPAGTVTPRLYRTDMPLADMADAVNAVSFKR